LESSGPISVAELLKRATLSKDDAHAALQELIESHQARSLKDDWLVATSNWSALKTKIAHELSAYHRANPLKLGMPREEMKSRLGLDTRTYNLVIEHALSEGVVSAFGSNLRVPDFAVVFKLAEQRSIDALIRQFRSAPWNTPSIKEAEQMVGTDVLAALIDLGQLIKLGDEVLLLPETYQSAVDQIRAHLGTNKTITVAQVRDRFNTSRKYALALMEYLDAHGITKRVGDERVLGNK
jgi:selenocysteine-specific elongation factor